jgi:hypothetical protein
MAKRRLKNIRVGRCAVAIHKDSEWGEFVVITKGPVKRFNGTYYTALKSDARSTAAAQIRWLRRIGGCL